MSSDSDKSDPLPCENMITEEEMELLGARWTRGTLIVGVLIIQQFKA